MLDPDQQAAAWSDPCRPLLVLAHAGTGKTRTLVERLLVLQQARRAGLFGRRSAGTIVALTFTRNAARELRERLADRANDDLDGYEVRTFHSLACQLYRGGWARDHDHRPRVCVATRAQSLRAATAAVRTVGLDVEPRSALRLFTDAKLGLPVRGADPALVRAALAIHDGMLAQQDLIHVHDMLVRPVQLLATIPALREELRARVACVVGDECQDWSPYQAALFAYLAGPEGYATACGDARQAIYGGSSPRFLLEFASVYPQARVVTLRTTYRLTGPLLDLSRSIAAHLPGGAIEGPPRCPNGPRPVVHIARTRAEEVAWIATYLTDLRTRGQIGRWSEAVVLARTRRQRDRLSAALRAAGLPVRAGTSTLAGRPAVVAVMAWLTLLRDPEDGAALLRALDAPPRGAQRMAPRSLRAALAQTGPWTMTRLACELPPRLSDHQRRELGALVRLYHGLRSLAKTEAPATVLEAVLERTGLERWLDARVPGSADDLIRLRGLLAEESDASVLEHLLIEETVAGDEDAVAIQTIHGYKGNEARAVVVAGVEEGLLPHPAVLRARNGGLEEEVRTFYVACTRSLAHLALTAAWEPDPGQGPGGPSRLFHLIDPHLVRLA